MSAGTISVILRKRLLVRPLAKLASSGTIALAALSASSAHAYCRTTVCQNASGICENGATGCKTIPGTVCTPAQPTDCGKPLFWRGLCVGYSVQRDASSAVTLDQTEKAIAWALDMWTKAPCEGGVPSIKTQYMGPVECRKHEYNPTGPNANVILFREDVWPCNGSMDTLALTTVTYNVRTGEIYDADMELNSVGTQFSFGDTDVGFDFLSIVTHELGHFLGLGHSADTNAVMWPYYMLGDIRFRNLTVSRAT